MRTALAAMFLLACGPGGRDNPVDGSSQGDSGSGSGSDAPPATDTSRVFAHGPGATQTDPDVLYRLNSVTFEPEMVGPISGLEMQHLQDLAIDGTDRMMGVTDDKLYTLDPATGAATFVANLSDTGFSSLSFVPADPTDPNSADILVTANTAGDVYQINADTGAMNLVGNYGKVGGDQLKSSGDLFGVRGFGIYATVNKGSEMNDYLVSINPQNGWKATIIGPTNFDHVFGIGFWGGKIYGFADLGFEPAAGKVIELNAQTGLGTVKNSAAIRWFGAGVTTDAPVVL